MDPKRFDAISRFVAHRRLSRREALARTGSGLAAASLAATGLATAGLVDGTAAQEATPAPSGSTPPEMLFVQSFQSGSIAPKSGDENRYTVTLDHGLGQTIYFSDRPDRIVGATSTDQFLDGLGFSPTNPPNAAIVTDNGEGESTLAVVSLFDPEYDAASATVTYEMAVLDHWQDSTELGFTETPVDLGAIGATFGTAHLFIDGCPNYTQCAICDIGSPCHVYGPILGGPKPGCWSSSDGKCEPCDEWQLLNLCNESYMGCGGECIPIP